jgi:hypothetical protein
MDNEDSLTGNDILVKKEITLQGGLQAIALLVEVDLHTSGPSLAQRDSSEM